MVIDGHAQKHIHAFEHPQCTQKWLQGSLSDRGSGCGTHLVYNSAAVERTQGAPEPLQDTLSSVFVKENTFFYKKHSFVHREIQF